MPHRSPRSRKVLAAGSALALLALACSLAPATATAAVSPWSAEEQQFVYELNRIRWDPALAGLDATEARPTPPLAVSLALGSAAGSRSDEMAEYDYFSHQSLITGLWPNEVARRFGYTLPPFWPDDANNIESIHFGQPTVSGVLQSFMNSTGHQRHLTGQGWYASHREIGVGANLGDRIWAVMTATDGSTRVFLTGVAYRDANRNSRMDLGEGLGGVTVAAGNYSTTTNVGGGWALAVAPGRYQVTASGGRFRGEATAGVTVGTSNVTVDFRSGRLRPLVLAYGTCAGVNPTILGTNGPDVITGTPGDDVIHGLGGSDFIDGLGGNDIICGGGGNDRLIGGDQRDVLRGGAGQDECLGARRYLGCESS
jgi:uncharacterized protein YkwD